MITDEFYFHRKRGLPRWERIGHPIDTLSVILPLSLLVLGASGPVYWGLAAFSTLLVTKDEWVHVRACSPFEQWLHSLLFVLHPIMFFVSWTLADLGYLEFVKFGLAGASVMFFYQLFYWNAFRKDGDKAC